MAAVSLLVGALCLLSSATLAGEAAKAGTCHALLIGGMPGAPVYARRYRDWLKRSHAWLTKSAGVPAANVVVLSGDKDFKDPIVRGEATEASVRKALLDLAGQVKPEDQFVLILVGHGAVGDMEPTTVLPGPDVSVRTLADGLDGIAARNQVVLNFTASAGDALHFLAHKGRVNVAATSPAEVNEPVFAEFFLRGLETGQADGEGFPTAGSKDGTITLLEACNWATVQTAMWISRQKDTDEGWEVEGKESIAIFRKLCEGPEGEPGARRLAPHSNPNKADEIVPLRPEGGKIDAWWTGRRVVAEHAVLEDCGEDKGATALRGKGYEPLDGARDGEPGCLARRVVLGRAELLPAGGK